MTSESLVVISKLKKPDNGFEILKLGFCKLDEKISDTAVDQLSQHANQLMRLEIYGEEDLQEADKQNVVDFAAKMVESQECIEELMLENISTDFVEEPSQEERRLINALLSLNCDKLRYLFLNENPSWFAHNEASSYLFEFIQETTCLLYLEMRDCKMTSEGTGKLFSALLKSESLKIIDFLILDGACDFSADETCSIFANFIDKATKRLFCSIHDQVGVRKIKVDYKKAEEDGKSGMIKITDKDTEQLILQVDTKTT